MTEHQPVVQWHYRSRSSELANGCSLWY